MLKNSFSLFFLLYVTTNSFAQYGFDLIDSATHSFCIGDTNTSIKYLELYSKQYPDNANTLLVKHRLGEFYIQAGDYKTALSQLTNALMLEPKIRFAIKGIDDCKLFDRNDYSSAKADICVTISKLYENLNDNEKALQYLNLADTKFLPSYGGCANGMIMYQTYLSLKYADLYLEAGDTTKAINRLLGYFMSGEYYSSQVSQKLKEFLRFKFSQKQIDIEIEKAIRTLKVDKKYEEGAPVKVYLFTLFGYTQRLPFDKLRENKKYLRKNENLNLLKS